MSVELLLAIPCAFGLLVAARLARHKPAISTSALLVLSGVALALPCWLLADDDTESDQTRVEIKRHVPHLEREGGYVTSQSCAECHPAQHASWHRSFHRTMTQLALPGNVIGEFDGQTILSNGLRYRVLRKGDEFWAEMPNPDLMEAIVQRGRKGKLEDIPRVERRVLMTTGSHHYQTYWVESTLPFRGRLMQTLPLVWLKEDRRWIPREAAFVVPPHDNVRFMTQWNHHCITCHSTGGIPGLNKQTGQLESRVGELGIACEACHGPGEKHVQRMRAAKASTELEVGDERLEIVNPANLDHRRSSEVCGQCHGVFVARNDRYAMEFALNGNSYRPGDDVHKTRLYIRFPHGESTPEEQANYERNREFYRQRWWEDGSILAGGREYTSMSTSGCFQRGEMSCLSCHSMHDAEPVDQVRSDRRDNRACTQCHTDPQYTRDAAQHTHHAAGTSGSDCMNCHMPYTAYGLLGAIRGHGMAPPNIDASIQLGVPNACNLCHLDKTLDWTQRHMLAWYEQQPRTLTDEQKNVSAAIVWMLKGDAPRRIITAWHLGWKPAQEASGSAWMAPYLARLLDDPYGVIRYVAARSLRSLPGFADFKYDFLATAAQQLEAAKTAVEQWERQIPGKPLGANAALLLDAKGRIDQAWFDKLYEARDDRPVHIKE